jgi:hypothetical protein
MKGWEVQAQYLGIKVYYENALPNMIDVQKDTETTVIG